MNGNFLWAVQDGGGSIDQGRGIAIDDAGNSYTTGFFEGTATIGDSTFNSVGDLDIFIAKYDVNGNFLWAVQDGDSSIDIGYGIAVDNAGNSCTIGFFEGTATIGDSTFNSVGSNDIFIAKYDMNGNFLWAVQDGGGSSDVGYGIAVDNAGNSYSTGGFRGTATIGDSTFNSVGDLDIFIAKYDMNGNFLWAIQDGGGSFDQGRGIAVDNAGNSYSTGGFRGTATIGDSTFNAVGDLDLFITKYDMNGNFLWAIQDGGGSTDIGRGIAVDDAGNSYTTGFFEGTATIGDSTFNAVGSFDTFIAKYKGANLEQVPIPTLSQWGLIILGLFISIFGVLGIRQRMVQTA